MFDVRRLSPSFATSPRSAFLLSGCVSGAAVQTSADVSRPVARRRSHIQFAQRFGRARESSSLSAVQLADACRTALRPRGSDALANCPACQRRNVHPRADKRSDQRRNVHSRADKRSEQRRNVHSHTDKRSDSASVSLLGNIDKQYSLKVINFML